MDILNCINRTKKLFELDIIENDNILNDLISDSRILIIGAAGSIGHATAFEVFKRNPKTLHLVDISENNLVEVVRSIRSSLGYIVGDFKTFAIDCGSPEFEHFMVAEGSYDYIFNLAAMKHVRSEKDCYTLMRLIEVNILNTTKILRLASLGMTKKYFCVSTDKAANPVNMMGGSKCIMEMFLMRESFKQCVSTARFANVAFSDGSLLYGFKQRIEKLQPIAAPKDIRRYFVTPQESGELCLMSCLLGENRDIFFPKMSEIFYPITFSEIVSKYLNQIGYEVYECESEEEARSSCLDLIHKKKWPCYFFNTDTTGEKNLEEFFTENEELDLGKYSSIGVIKNEPKFDENKLSYFQKRIIEIKQSSNWKRQDLVHLFKEVIPHFDHKETGKFLDQKM